MTKVITYNNIQLSFNADTSGIKASKAELGALTRQVNAQRTPLEKFMRQLEVINQKSRDMAPKDVQDRIRAVANTFLEAEKKAGRYRDALSAVEAFTPQLAQEAQNLRKHYDDLIKTEKELAEINQRLAGEERLRQQQNESKRLQVERQVLQFKKEQQQAAAAAAKQDAQIADKLAANRKKVLKQERDDYVAHYDSLAAASKKIQSMVIQPKDLEAINAQIAKEKELAQIEVQKANRRKELERIVRRIFQNEGEIIATNRRRAKREAEEYKKEVLAKYDAEIAAQEKRNQILLKEEAALREKQAAIHRTLLKQERDEYVAHYDRLAAASKKLQSMVFAPAENAKILAERSAAAELELQNQRMTAGLGIQIFEQSKQILSVRQQSVATIQAENKALQAQKENQDVILSLRNKLLDLQRSEKDKAALSRQAQIDQFRQREFEKAAVQVQELKRKAAETMTAVDPNALKSIFENVRNKIKEHISLLNEVEAKEKQITQRAKERADAENAAMREQNRIANANARLQSLVIQPQQHQRILRQQAIADERRHNAELERRRNLIRDANRDLMAGAAMAGMPGGMFFGMSRSAIGGFAAAGAIVASLKAYSDLRNQLVRLEVQFGDTAIAAQKFAEIRLLAAQSPLQTSDLMSAATTLAQYGINAKELIPILSKLSEISMGDANRMEGLARAFAQVKAAGRLMGQEVLQFTNSGFNPLNAMAQHLAKTFGGLAQDHMPWLKKQMEEGKIAAQDVADTLTMVTSKGGQFFEQNKKQAEELTAKYNALIDSVKKLGEAFGEMLAPVAKPAMSKATFIFENYAASFKAIGEVLKITAGSADRKTFTEIVRNLENELIAIEQKNLGINFDGISKENGKLFQNLEDLKRKQSGTEAKELQEKQDKALAKIKERTDALDKAKKLEDEIAQIAMSDMERKRFDANKRLEEIKAEILERSKAEIEADAVRRNSTVASQRAIAEAMKKANADIAKATLESQRLPFMSRFEQIRKSTQEDFFKKSPQAKIMQEAGMIANMIKLGMLSVGVGSQELARVMSENTTAVQQQSQELPRTIQAGTVEAYQAMFGKENTAKLQLTEQKRQNDKLSEANGLLRDLVNKQGIGVIK